MTVQEIVLTGITGLRNRGVEALVRTTVEGLAARFPGARFSVFTLSPDYDAHALARDDVSYLSNPFHGLPGASPLRRLAKSVNKSMRGKRSALGAAQERLAAADLVVAVGGDVFSSDYGALRSHLKPLQVAQELGRTIVLQGQSIGPFKSSDETTAWVGLAKNTRLITTRESLSQDYTKSLLNGSGVPVELAADSAFLLGTDPDPTWLRDLYPIFADGPVVAVAPSAAISRYSKGDRDQHLAFWLRLLNEIRYGWRAKILFVPHVQEVNPGNDDRALVTDLVRALGPCPGIAVAGLDHNAVELKTLISLCDFVVAERMHAAIAGLSTAVPTFVVGYSVKGEGILRDLFAADRPEELPLMSIADAVASESSHQRIAFFWQNRGELADQLNQVLPEARRLAARNFDLIGSALA